MREARSHRFPEPRLKQHYSHVSFFHGAWPPGRSFCPMKTTPEIHLVILLGLLYAGMWYIVDQASLMAFPWCDHPTHCFDYTEELAASVDSSVDPCDNLFEHVCGRWDRNHPIPFGSSQFFLLQQRLLNVILRTLERPPLHPLPVVRTSVLAFQSCLSVYKERRDDTKVLFDLFKGFKSEWPSLSLPSDFDAMDFLLGLSLDYDLPTPFVLRLEPYLKTDKRYGLSLYLVIESDERGKIKKFDAQAIAKCMPRIAPMLESSDVSVMAERISKVRTDINSVIDALFSTARITRHYRTVKLLANDTASYATLDTWLKVINKHLPQDRQIGEGEDVLIFNNTGYILRETLARTKRSRYVDLVLFAGWNILASRHAAVSHALTDCFGEINIHAALSCVNFVDEVAAFAMTRLVVDTLGLSSAVQTTQMTWAAVRKATRNSFSKLTWIDGQTAAGAEDHVDNLKPLVPFPAHLNTSVDLEAFHDYLPTLSSKPFIEWLLIALNKRSKKYKRLLREGATSDVHRDDLPYSSTLVNAYYLPLTHLMIIPAAIMGPPFLLPKEPFAVNFGAIGKVLGHELTHSFDPLFSDLTRTGEVATWWGDQSLINFTARLDCVEQQVAIYTADKKHAKNALSETFADTAGVEKARLALDTLSDGPGILGYSRDQLFYVAGCFEFCNDAGYEQGAIYPAFALRCNLPVSNQKRFAEAFKCAEGAALNLPERCTFH
ncbi:hypothetical protein V5799_034009 [Amblyomma americanum]|uniref:M13 family peptidase n=1 Tax=Amblyomma americanum TaxID=6943 RepID=A0AAQ4DLP1_AMBAM